MSFGFTSLPLLRGFGRLGTTRGSSKGAEFSFVVVGVSGSNIPKMYFALPCIRGSKRACSCIVVIANGESGVLDRPDEELVAERCTPSLTGMKGRLLWWSSEPSGEVNFVAVIVGGTTEVSAFKMTSIVGAGLINGFDVGVELASTSESGSTCKKDEEGVVFERERRE
jgi:hypothetical protein